MKKYLLISMILSLLVTGDVIDKQPQDAAMESLTIETVNAFKLPVGVHQHCCFNTREWQEQNFRMVHADLNNDGKEEILLEYKPIDYFKKKTDKEVEWIVLQKTFNDSYICIGKIGTPIKINRRKDSTWSEIVAYRFPGESYTGDRKDNDSNDDQSIDVTKQASRSDEKDYPKFVLYHYIVGRYKELVSTDWKSGLSVSQVPAELERLMSPENVKIRNDDSRRVVEAGSELAASFELFRSLLLKTNPEQRKELIFSVMENIKGIYSYFLRSMFARTVADMLLELRAYKQARDMYEVALDAQIHHSPDDSVDYAEILNNYAVVFCRTGNLPMAEQTYSKAVQIYRTAIVKDSLYKRDLASSLINLAAIYCKQKKYASSEKITLEVIQIFESLPFENLEEEHIGNLGAAYGILAVVYDKTGRDAKDCLGKALEIFEKVPRPKTIEFRINHAAILGYLSVYYQKKGKQSEAIVEQEKSKEIWSIVVGNNQFYLPEFCESTHTLACLLRDSGKVEKSLALFEGIMKFRLKLAKQGEWKLQLAYFDTVIETIVTYVKTQKYTEAQQLLDFAEKQEFYIYIDSETEKRFKKAKAEVESCMKR